uniref:Uncharacterized protein n=1 Tax=Ditylenchus dipsaci TaxID=166011 RepID=A0A915EKA1_9BILA
MGEEDEEQMDGEPDDEDVIEFEDVLSEYLDATDMTERMPNAQELRAAARTWFESPSPQEGFRAFAQPQHNHLDGAGGHAI